MELWIRSQDKRYLLPIHDILSVFDKGIFYQGIILGIYKTEKRALEVLDEIGYLMIPVKETFDENGESEGINYFANKNYMYYEMPKD